MAKPTILTVDDDPEVLRAVERDLRQRYGKDFRIVRAESGATALDALRQLEARQEPVALVLSDQRMPQMNGVELLEQTRTMLPAAKRVLLTAYADTNAAIDAINSAQIDYYLLKPWDPPDQGLYPIVDDLLEDWRASYRPPFTGVRVIDTRWSPAGHALRDFLAGNSVPYRWLDVETSDEGRRLFEAAGGDPALLPLVVLPDGARLPAADVATAAERVGIRTRAKQPFYDVIIVGGGPAGLAAAVYGASEGLKVMLIERQAPGGQAGTSSRIENYLGFPSGLSGADLARRAVAQAERFGVEIVRQDVIGVKLDGQYRVIALGDGSEVRCHALVVATGVSYRKLDIEGIETLTGRGVYYGAALVEAVACKNEDVVVVGGANSAGQGAVHLANYARKVVLLTRSPLEKGMSHYLIEQIRRTPNIEVRVGGVVAGVGGSEHLESVSVADTKTGATETLPATSLFVFIGAAPRTEWLAGVVERDAQGFLCTGPDLMRVDGRVAGWPLERDPFLLETNVPGVFAVGDVRRGSVKRVASAVGEGSITISFVHQHLSSV